MFFFVGLLFAILLLITEHFLWFSPTLRTFLFWFTIVFEFVVFYGLVLNPILKLLEIQNGIGYEFASKIIGDHFPEIKDKLLNVLQLKKQSEQSEQSELLLASIAQKSDELKTFSFKKAVNFSNNIKYVKYALIPVFILFVFYGFGKHSVLTDSLNRVVNHNVVFTPPPPFEFSIVNKSLSTIEGDSFTLIVQTKGLIVPETVNIVYNNEIYSLNSRSPGVFEHQFLQPKEPISFKLISGDVSSLSHKLAVLPAPLILKLNLYVYPPKYTKQPITKVSNSGNSTVPEGSILKWEVFTKATDTVAFLQNNTQAFFSKSNQQFSYTRSVSQPLRYSISTSNVELKNHENLDYFVKTVKDEPPVINVKMKRDSTLQERLYFYGQASDDYGIRHLRLHYFPTKSPDNSSVIQVLSTQNNPQEFVHVFPENLNLLEDTAYSLYFEVTDNDHLHNYKSTRSQTFTYKQKTEIQLEASRTKEQSEVSSAFQKALNTLVQQDKQLKAISINQRESVQLNYSDNQKLKQFIERQKQQDKLLKKLNQTLEKNLSDFKKEGQDVFKEQLSKRVKSQQEELDKNEKILEEIETNSTFSFEKINQRYIIVKEKEKNLSGVQILDNILITGYLTKGIQKNKDATFTIKPKKLEILPGLIEADILESIHLLPGVVSLNETASGFAVRGGSLDQNRIIWDGITMYHKGHLFGM